MPKKNVKSAYDAYGYREINGKLYYGLYVPTGDGKKTEFVRYGRYVGVEQVSKDLDGGSPVLTIAYDTLDDTRETVDVKREILGKKKEVQAVLLRCDADAYDTSVGVLMNCLRKSEETAERGLCFHRTGWMIEGANTDQEQLCFKGNTLISSKVSNTRAPYIGSYDLSRKGSFAKWKDLVNSEVIGHAALETAILIGLSPIISSEWGCRNLIFHFVGDSGTGKTASSVLALSTVGCPNPAETAKRLGLDGKPMRTLLSSWKGTANALIGKLDGLDGTLMVFDELSKVEDSRILTSTIYTLADGADKDRMESPTAMQTTNVIRTNVLSVGEESLLEKAGNQNSGLNVRVFEISTEFTNSAAQADAIYSGCYENYGFAAPRFQRYIVENMTFAEVADLRERNLDEYTLALRNAGSSSKTVRRLAEFGAILLTVADIATEALGIPFSRNEIIEFLVKQQVGNDVNTDIGMRAYYVLHGFVNANIGSFITNGSLVWTKSVPCYGKVEQLDDGSGMEVIFEKQAFERIVRQLGFTNPTLILKQLKAKGLLVHEAGKLYRKRQITKAGGQVRVIVIRFPDIMDGV